MITVNGDLQVTDNVKAEGSLNAETQGKGNIALGQNVDVENDMVIKTDEGNITVGKDITANQGSVTLTTGTGSITVGVDDGSGQKVGVIVANDDVNINAGTGTGTGNNVNIETSVESKAADVNVKVKDGDIHIGNNGLDVDTVTAKQDVTLETTGGKITVDGKTSTQDGDITLKAANKEYVAGESGRNIIINHTGKVESGHDANLIAENGDLHVTDRVTAQGALNAETRKQGEITLDDAVNVVNDITMKTETGNITVGKKVTADNGSVSMTTGTGNIVIGADIKAGQAVGMTTGTGNVTVGEDVKAGNNVSMDIGTGNVTVGSNGVGTVTAANDVAITVNRGNVSVEKKLTATSGNVDVLTKKGNIHVGDNGPKVKTVTAGKDVNLETESGKIEIYGKTSNAKNGGGDITLKAASDTYVSGGQNIIIAQNGLVGSDRDVNLITENGDLHVTDRIKAGRDINAITQTKGDISLDSNITVNGGSILMKADTGNINAGSKVKAANRITAETGDGDITVGTADARYVSLTSGGKDGHVTANTIRTQANGNRNGTGKEDIRLGGSYVNVETVVNKNSGATPLTLSTLGPAADKAMKDFRIGKQNADGTYSGGIRSASGAVVQELWSDNAMLYIKGDTNLHVSKLVVNEKLHAANDNISVAVFGVPPYHDGARVVFWNDTEKNNPSGMLGRWYNRSYTDPVWMYLDLFNTGEVGSRYGVLMDTYGYSRIYGDSVSVVDTMRRRLEPYTRIPDIVYFDRNNLIQIDDDESGVSSGEVTVE